MTKTITILFIIGILLSCKKESEYDKLPPITTTGENTFACLVNGNYFTYKHGFMQTNLHASLNKGSVSITATHITHGTVGLSIVRELVAEWKLETPCLYILKSYYDQGARFYDKNSEITYTVDSSQNCIGEIEFLRIDTLEMVLSGTFWFDAIDQDGNITKIREGRFDISNACCRNYSDY